MPTTDSEITADEAEQLVGKRVKFYTDEERHANDGALDVKVRHVDFPYVDGVDDFNRQIRVDLREVRRIEIREADSGRTLGLIAVTGLSVVVLVALAGSTLDTWDTTRASTPGR